VEFFNKKEEVIYVELTGLGKQRLQDGRFRPTYYSFHDKDIVYNASEVANVTEAQNDIEDRIFETPRVKFALPHLVETNSTRTSGRGIAKDVRQIGNILGESDEKTQQVPWLYLAFLDNIFDYSSSSAEQVYYDLHGINQNIPQINFTGTLKSITEQEVAGEGYGVLEAEKIKFFITENLTNQKDEFEMEVLIEHSSSEFGKKLYNYHDFHQITPGQEVVYDSLIRGIDFDDAIDEYDDLRNKYYLDILDKDNRVYFVKNIMQAAEGEKQPRTDIYEVDDPGDICDD
jgi:hypothetical protein